MTEIFTASNGIEIEISEYGFLLGKGDCGSGPTYATAGPEGIAALREFFQHERDQELGRWRDPETGLLVYPAGAMHTGPNEEHRAVHVLDEQDPPLIYLTHEGDATTHDRRDRPEFQAARRYFAAHPEPEPRPWENAPAGELWVLTSYDRTTYRALSLGSGDFVDVDNTEWAAAAIKTATRLHPPLPARRVRR